MALVLVTLALVTYFVIKQNVIKRADAQAMELSDAFLSTVRAEMADASEANNLREGVAAAISEHRFRDVIFAVFDERGQLVGVSDDYGEPGADRRVSSDAPRQSAVRLAADADGTKSVRIGGRVYRCYVRHFSADHQDASLVVLQSLQRQNEFLGALASVFAIVIPLTILLAAAGGYLFARHSLAPVVAMSAQASRMGAENLGARLDVKNSRDELGQLAVSFNGLLDRVSESFDRQKKFVADASHELRTPVAILCGETEVTLGKQGRGEQEYRESLRIVGEEAKRLRQIVEDLFTLARADAGQHPLLLTSFYLDELVAECAKNVRTLALAKEIAVTCEADEEYPIYADETLLRRMVLNLLDNAIKYTPYRGKVTLRCREENEFYQLSVQDSGPGIVESLQPRIFERFFRADKARSRQDEDGGGAGLGLAIASWIANVHGGNLQLTQSNSAGSVFTATLPKQTQQG